MRGFALTFALSVVGLLASPALPVSAQSSAPLPEQRPTDAQSPIPPQPAGTTFRTATELVALNVTVTDPTEHYVTGLSKDDFAVFEDGIPQNVTFFAASNVPLDLTIMIDTSASMTDKIAFVHEAATNFVHTLRSGDRAEILGFSEGAEVLAPFTGDIPTLESAIASTSPHGSTALYTSLYVAVEDLSRLARQQHDVRRQAIVVLTDGEDTSSLLSFDDLLSAAKRAGVAVYSISVVSPFDVKRLDDSGAHRFSDESDFALRMLSQETGARSFFPLTLRDLNGVYQQIAEELSTQYSLGYAPKVHDDGAFHRLAVRILHHPGARPRTRSGYYSSRPIRAALLGGSR